ncbi:MAG: hypothetical protein BWX68_03081 [Verrucomicrobia bacterium ADurb.Bin063]|nr:MAG: hypothetical protein BWX68_03081 [Verrucomicrobia bacterium ADurb.Bin063]
MKRAMAGVLHLGSIIAVPSPSTGAMAAKAYRDSRTTCRQTLGRTGSGAQQERNTLMRPKRPSSMNRIFSRAPCCARSCATIWAYFF